MAPYDLIHNTFSQSVSLTQNVVLSVRLSICLFQLASKLPLDIIARRRSDYCPRGAIFRQRAASIMVLSVLACVCTNSYYYFHRTDAEGHCCQQIETTLYDIS